MPTDVPEADDLAQAMEAQWKEVEAALQHSKARMMAGEEGIPLEFGIGEEAWLNAKNINLRTLRLLSKVKRDDKHAFENSLPLVTIDGEEEYRVEGITDSEEHNGKWYFWVKWKGYRSKENTWEPQENLKNATNLLEKYKKEMNKKALGIAKALRGGAVL
ncbi:hypothetical protein RhiTH_005075 [Rhizoctonia solani]